MTYPTDLAASAEVRSLMARATPRLRQADLAEALCISQPSLSRRLNGLQAFTVGELAVVAEFLGVDLAALLGSPAEASA